MFLHAIKPGVNSCSGQIDGGSLTAVNSIFEILQFLEVKILIFSPS